MFRFHSSLDRVFALCRSLQLRYMLEDCWACGLPTSRSVVVNSLTRFNKILTRLPSQTTGSRWQVDKEVICLSRVQQFSHLCVARPYQISVNSIFEHIHTTSINTIIWQFFHSFITLCEKEYLVMSNLHCSLTNAALCPLVLLPSLSLKYIFLPTSS